MVLIAIVFLLMAVLSIVAITFVFGAGSRSLIVRKQIVMEQAMYVAEGGIETAVAHIDLWGASATNLTGTIGFGTFAAAISLTNIVGQATSTVLIRSVGTVKGVSRIVNVRGLRNKTWAKYALWSSQNHGVYFISGEKFYGPVHANDDLWFSGDPEFFSRVTSASSTFGGSTNSCVFHDGYYRPVPTDTMAAVDFSSLKSNSTLVVTGATTIVFSGTNALVTNSARKWTKYVYKLVPETVIYAADSGSKVGTVDVSGRLDGRVTLVADTDIQIVSNLTYAVDPATNSASNDALGLISGRDIIVKTSFPNNGEIHAHMMATGKSTTGTTDGSFGVENYSSRSPSGTLTVYGGIVQNYRGAVGTFSGSSIVSGFSKNYTYDSRFSVNPPPRYPPLSDEFGWEVWKEGD